MVSYTVLAISVAAALLLACLVGSGVVYAVYAVRSASVNATTSTEYLGAHSAPFSTDPQIIRALGERIVLLESRLPTFQAALDSYGNLTQRLADVEGRLPNLIEAYDKFSQNVQNADKRAATRASRDSKKTADESEGITVEQAVAQMGMAGNPSGTIDETVTENPQKRLGVYGQGGNGARRK